MPNDNTNPMEWEKDFDEMFEDSPTEFKGQYTINILMPNDGFKYAHCSNIKQFIHSLLHQERKRIEEEATKMLMPETFRDGMHEIELEIVRGNCLLNMGIRKVLQIINKQQ